MAGTTWLILSMGLMAATAQMPQQVSISIPLGGAMSNGPFRTDDFIRQNQAQYNNTLHEYETTMANCRTNYQQRTKDLEYQTRLLGERVLQVDETLNPLEMLNDFSRTCVRQYRGQFNNWLTVKATLDACVTTASNNLNNVLWQPENTKRTLSNYYNNQMKNGLNACVKKNPDMQLNYTLCVQLVIEAANTYTSANRRTFFTQMRAAHCTIDNYISTAMDCASTANYNAVFGMGDAMRSIEDCVSGAHTCAPCSTDDCAQLEIDPFSNATIVNPFYYINKDVKCALVTFKPSVEGTDIVNADVRLGDVVAVNARVGLQNGVKISAGVPLANGLGVKADVPLLRSQVPHKRPGLL